MSKHEQPDRIWTVLDIIRWGTEYFKERSIDSPRLTIELMLCSVLETTRISLYSNFERPLNKEELKTLRGYVQRRAHNEPLQYILKNADFYSLQFHVTPDVLIPRPETEHVVELVINHVAQLTTTPVLCMDVGTGEWVYPGGGRSSYSAHTLAGRRQGPRRAGCGPFEHRPV